MLIKNLQYDLKILIITSTLLVFSIQTVISQNDSQTRLKTFNVGLTTGVGGINRSVLPLPTIRLSVITLKTTIPIKYLSISADCDCYKFKLPRNKNVNNSSIYLTLGYSDEYGPWYIKASNGSYETRYYGMIGVRRYSESLFMFSFAVGTKYIETMKWDVDDLNGPQYGKGWDYLAELTLTLYFRKNFKSINETNN